MRRIHARIATAVVSVFLGASTGLITAAPQPVGDRAASARAADVPIYVLDPAWPKLPLPNHWAVGHVVGASIDSADRLWVVHRTRTFMPPQGECCVPAPAVIVFDRAGALVQAWGGPRFADLPKAGHGGPRATWVETGPIPAGTLGWREPMGFTWPESEHNIFVDYKSNVWLGNNGGSHYLKFTKDGTFLLQIGRAGVTGQNNADLSALSQPTGAYVDPKDNEVYVADGYVNRRVIVFDADTGAYKRHWGAYGKPPVDVSPTEVQPTGLSAPHFDTVHCLGMDKDRLLWVCDRGNSRIQVFTRDGTFVKEGGVAPEIRGGAAFDLAFSRDTAQRFVFVSDARTNTVWILRRSDMKTIGSIGSNGHWPGQFTMAHNLAVDSSNNLYVTEGAGGQRIQRFLFKGLKKAPATRRLRGLSVQSDEDRHGSQSEGKQQQSER